MSVGASGFATALVASLSAWALAVPGVPLVPRDTADRALFEAVVRDLLEETPASELRVDPRPLRGDPSLVTLVAEVGEIIPDRVDPDAHHAPLAVVPDSVIQTRRDLLRRLEIPEANALRDAQAGCPGHLVPPTAETVAWKRERCPRTAYRSAMISLPRAGGAYWPGNVHKRTKYGDWPISSVRVIIWSMSPDGATETSWDYVFEHLGNNRWSLLEVKPLMVVH